MDWEYEEGDEGDGGDDFGCLFWREEMKETKRRRRKLGQGRCNGLAELECEVGEKLGENEGGSGLRGDWEMIVRRENMMVMMWRGCPTREVTDLQ